MTLERRRAIAAHLARNRERLGGTPLLNFPELYLFAIASLTKDDVLDDAFFHHFTGQSRILLGPALEDGRIVGWTVQ